MVALIVGGGVANAVTATADDPHHVDRPKTVEKRYLYSATFTAAVTHDLTLVLPGPNNDDVRRLSASIAGVHPALELSTTEPYSLIPRSTRSAVRVQGADATTVLRTDDGRTVVTCEGHAAEVVGRPTPVPALPIGQDLLLYGSLAFPTSCTDNQGGPTGTAKYFLPPLQAEALPVTGKVGDKVLTYSLEAGVGTAPLPYVSVCPGYEEGASNTCAYRISGTLTLKLIKELAPTKGSSKGAAVSPGAKKATAQVQCPAACRVEIEVMPLRGSPRVLAHDTFSLKPGKGASLPVLIPARNRGPAVRSGGVRIKITYRITGAGAISEIRRALL